MNYHLLIIVFTLSRVSKSFFGGAKFVEEEEEEDAVLEAAGAGISGDGRPADCFGSSS